tara:strand:+ start:23484 stop:23609 length:126 start_codon:yes stop_codon:yes gene_type:complete
MGTGFAMKFTLNQRMKTGSPERVQASCFIPAAHKQSAHHAK